MISLRTQKPLKESVHLQFLLKGKKRLGILLTWSFRLLEQKDGRKSKFQKIYIKYARSQLPDTYIKTLSCLFSLFFPSYF
jgi:hypothetical protein